VGGIKTLGRLLKRALRRFAEDEGSVHAGHAAFSTLLALFPFLIFLTTLAAFFGAAQRADHFVALTFNFLPPEVAKTLAPTIKEVMSNKRGSLLTISMIGTVWAASSGVEALRAALNRAYDVARPRGFVFRRLQGVALMTLAAGVVLVVTSIVVVGPLIWKFATTHFEIPRSWTWLWLGARFGFAVLVIFAGAAVLYRWLPDHAPGWRYIWPGAVLTAVLWMGLANLFSVYLKNVGQYHAVYGSLGGIIMTLVFFFASAIIFVFGAEWNAALKWDRRRGETEAANAVRTRSL